MQITTRERNGWNTQQFSWPVGSPKRIICFVPGNPGLPRFYTVLFDTVQSEHPTTAIYAQSHLGQHESSASPKDSSTPPTLKDLEEQHADFIQELYDTHKIPVTVVAHSMGAYLVSRILPRKAHIIRKTILLMPTVSHMAESPNGLRLSRFFSEYSTYALSTLAAVFKYTIPQSLLTTLVGYARKTDEEPLTVLTTLTRSPHLVSNVLTLARYEMQDITDLDISVFGNRDLMSKCLFYWCQDGSDRWVPEFAIDEIVKTGERANVPSDIYVRDSYGVKHAFSLVNIHSAMVAQWLGANLD